MATDRSVARWPLGIAVSAVLFAATAGVVLFWPPHIAPGGGGNLSCAHFWQDQSGEESAALCRTAARSQVEMTAIAMFSSLVVMVYAWERTGGRARRVRGILAPVLWIVGVGAVFGILMQATVSTVR